MMRAISTRIVFVSGPLSAPASLLCRPSKNEPGPSDASARFFVLVVMSAEAVISCWQTLIPSEQRYLEEH